MSSLYCGVLPDVSLKPLEELFRARVITFLVDKGLLPAARANMLRGWAHSGFNVHRSRRVLPDEREDLERLAQYIIRNPFAVESRAEGETGCPQGSNEAKRHLRLSVNNFFRFLSPFVHAGVAMYFRIPDPPLVRLWRYTASS